MQNVEGVCANMKQACVFTARGADRADDGGRVGAHFTFHLREGQPFSQNVRTFGLEG